jgi:hypothetical protein
MVSVRCRVGWENGQRDGTADRLSRHSTFPVRTDQWIGRPARDGDELAAVADGLGDHGPTVWLGAVLGLRCGEVAALRVDSLTLQVYARATAEGDRRAAELMGERFRPRDERGKIA